jgi:hypothetical protein
MTLNIFKLATSFILMVSADLALAQGTKSNQRPAVPPSAKGSEVSPSANPVLRKEDLPPMASPIDPAQEEFKEKARKRLYPGGSDQDDLRVQSDVPKPEKNAQDAARPAGAPRELETEGF